MMTTIKLISLKEVPATQRNTVTRWTAFVTHSAIVELESGERLEVPAHKTQFNKIEIYGFMAKYSSGRKKYGVSFDATSNDPTIFEAKVSGLAWTKQDRKPLVLWFSPTEYFLT